MIVNDLLDLTLREVLDTYCALYNLECGHYYGITTFDNCDKLFDEYNISDEYPEAMSVENLIHDDVLVSLDEELIDYPKLEYVMKNLGISKKG